jgi:uncharacterized membrane protein YhfC
MQNLWAIILAAIGGAVFINGAFDGALLDMALGTITMFIAASIVE